MVALERDEALMPTLKRLEAQYPKRLRVVWGNARDFRLSQSGLEPPFCVVGNLPYYIATHLILSWSTQTEGVKNFCLMVQKEVGERIAKGSGSVLGVLLHRVFKAELLWHIGREHFNPPPKVTSCMIRLTPLAECGSKPHCEEAVAELEFVLRAAFKERRKMLGTSLKPHPLVLEALASHRISPKLRPQDVTPYQWFAVAQSLKGRLGELKAVEG